MKPQTRPLTALALGAVLATAACGQANPSVGGATPAPGGASGATQATPSATDFVPPIATQTVAQTGGTGTLRLEATMTRTGHVQGGSTVGTGAGMSVRPGLLVSYRLTNAGSTPVLADDVVPQDLGSATLPAGVDVQHAWVFEQSGVLRLSKQGFATAPNVRFAAAPVIGAHAVAPGATLSGRAYAVWPLALDVPGESFQAPRQPVDPAVATWQLCIQVDGRTAQARPSALGGVLQVPTAAPQAGELVCTDPAAIPAP